MTIQEAIKEYSESLSENLTASQVEQNAKEAKRKAYYRLQRAKEALRGVESDILTA